MIGLDATTGQAIDGNAHLAQSVADILSTPLGSRVMRRDYGSMLFDLIDKPNNPVLHQLLRAATAVALARWEPRLRLRKVQISGDPGQGNTMINIEAVALPSITNASLTLSIPLRPFERN